MAKEEKGFFDGLVDDFCRDLELKAAIEATRDENGKVDKWAATGAAFGLGHTSDDDIAMLGAMLGAEGAFDPDTENTDEFDDYDNISDIPATISTPVFSPRSTNYMSKSEFEEKKRNIISNAKTSIWIIVIAAIGLTIGMLSGVTTESGVTGVVCIGFLAILGWGLYYFSNQKEKDLQRLETEYAQARKQAKEEETKKWEEIAETEYEVLKNHCGTNDFCDVLNQVYNKAKLLMDKADAECEITYPTYDRSVITALLNSILYYTIKECGISATQKSALFDLAISRCGTKTSSGFTGNMLFLKYDREIDDSMRSVLNEVLAMITVAASKSGISNAITDYTKTLCSWILLLNENLKEDILVSDFGDKGVHVVLTSVQKAVQTVMDEHW